MLVGEPGPTPYNLRETQLFFHGLTRYAKTHPRLPEIYLERAWHLHRRPLEIGRPCDVLPDMTRRQFFTTKTAPLDDCPEYRLLYEIDGKHVIVHLISPAAPAASEN